jgi:cyclase
MKKKRIIPIVLFKDGFVVQSKLFSEFRNLGNPYDSLRRLSEWSSDEVSFIDIGPGEGGNQLRSDLGRQTVKTYLEVLTNVSEITRMPLSSGGRITKLQDISERLSRGADKVVINTAAFTDPSFLTEAVKTFGSQCVTVSMDVRRIDGEYRIFSHRGSRIVPGTLDFWLNLLTEMQVGELLLTSVDRDGTKLGFDTNLIRYAAGKIKIPLVVCGGAGNWNHFEEVLGIDGVEAVAAANIFQHIDQSVYLAHKYLYDRGVNVRRPQLLR